MTEETKPKSLFPHIALAAVVVVILIFAYFSLTGSDEPSTSDIPVPEVPADVVPEKEPVDTEAIEEEYDVQDNAEAMEPSEVEMPDPEPVPEPEPLDTSDGTIKTAIVDMSNTDAAASILVNDNLLRRFVVMTENVANQTTAPNHQIVQPPEQEFRVYEQAEKTYIDASSFKRYTPYVETFDSMDTDQILAMYETYKPAISDIYSEIGDPDDNFDYVLIDAINHMLDTPEVPFPIEVYTDSVMYKFKDERLENLSAPQKQLLRTGPENMRRIKAKLRELKAVLQ